MRRRRYEIYEKTDLALKSRKVFLKIVIEIPGVSLQENYDKLKKKIKVTSVSDV